MKQPKRPGGWPQIDITDVRALRDSAREDADLQALCARAERGQQDAWWLVKRHLMTGERTW